MEVKEILEDKENYYIASELCEGGELFDKILELEKFSEFDAADIMCQVVSAINFMHKKKMAHRDMKPENILLTSKDSTRYEIKVTDFGFSCFYDPGKKLSLALGTPRFMAPELVMGMSYNESVDIWSIGVITYMLLSGRFPFNGNNDNAIRDQITRREVDTDKSFFDATSQEAKDFI